MWTCRRQYEVLVAAEVGIDINDGEYEHNATTLRMLQG